MFRVKTAGKVIGVLVGLLLLTGGGLVAYAGATGNGRMSFPDAPAPEVSASTDPEVIERGRYLVHGPAHCASCHAGSADRPADRTQPELIHELPLAGGLSFEMGPLATRYGRNLTPDPETGIGRQTDAELARAIRSAVMHDGELSFFMKLAGPNLSDEDLTAVISYLRSLEPVRSPVPRGEWDLFGKVLLTYVLPPMEPRPAAGPVHVPPSGEPSVARGEYLAEHVALCVMCHTAMDPTNFQVVGPKAGGSLPDPSHGVDDKHMEYVAPNLTSHPTGWTGRVDEDAFVARLLSGRAFTSSIMPWENYSNMTEADARSIYRYLRTLPPVDAELGPSYREIGSWPPKGD